MADNRIAGVAYLKVDGEQIELKGSFKYQINTVKREPLVGQSGVVGFKEMPAAPHIAGEVFDMPGTRVRRLEDIVDATVQLELANGKTIVLRGAWWEDASEVDTEGGSYPVKFCGLEGFEVL
jgi:hypothetical protein